MLALLDVILPVFLVVALGYLAVWRRIVSDGMIDGLMGFSQKIGIPFLLFRAIAHLDISSGFHPALLFSFYTGALISFILGMFGARVLFARDWQDSVAIGFICLFSNSVLLGLPITERAYGADNLSANFAIIAFHAPFCYGIGITVMEVIRARGTKVRNVVSVVLAAMFRNALILGILAGVAVNVMQLPLPRVAWDAVDILARAALPTALFGLGGVLYRYRPEGDLRVIGMVCAISLLVHPTLVYLLGSVTGVSQQAFKSMVLTAAMAPGINTYLFADMYGRAKRVAASAVRLATGLSILSIWFWLGILG